MKWLLISAVFNLNMTYADEETCELAREKILAQDPKALCIPRGDSEHETLFDEFFEIIKRLEKTEQSELDVPQI